MITSARNQCYSLKGRNHISHPHKINGKIIFLNILNMRILENRRDESGFRND
jgi:hypothetical protein